MSDYKVARLEEIGSRLVAAEPRLSIMCGYAVERFDTASGVRLRSICRQHTHAIAAERGPTPAPADVTAPPPAERARAFNRLLATSPQLSTVIMRQIIEHLRAGPERVGVSRPVTIGMVPVSAGVDALSIACSRAAHRVFRQAPRPRRPRFT